MPSYEKRKPSGLWSVRFKTITPEGLEKQKRLSGYKTKKEAQYAYEEYIKNPPPLIPPERQITTLPEPAVTDMTFDQLVEKFYAFKRNRIKPASFYDLEKKISSRILPFFGTMKVKDITPPVVLDWQDKISTYSHRYQKHLFGYMKSIYRFADKYHDIPNIMTKVDPPRDLEGKKEMLFWTPEEFSMFISKVDRINYSTFFKFLYLSGCRKGEALALTWKDFDFEKHTVKISKNVAYKVGKNGKSYQVTTPKNTNSNRTLYLPPFFFDELKEYRAWQEENTTAQSFVFGAEDPFPPTSIERVMKAAENASGVKHIRIHDLRHSCASYLIHKGVTIVAVSKHLGHASTKQTLDTYSHLLPDDNSMIIRALSELSLPTGSARGQKMVNEK